MDNRKLEQAADRLLASLDMMAKAAWERELPQYGTAFVDSKKDAEALADAIRPEATERIRRGLAALTVSAAPAFGKLPLPGGGTMERWMCWLIVERSEAPPPV